MTTPKRIASDELSAEGHTELPWHVEVDRQHVTICDSYDFPVAEIFDAGESGRMNNVAKKRANASFILIQLAKSAVADEVIRNQSRIIQELRDKCDSLKADADRKWGASATAREGLAAALREIVNKHADCRCGNVCIDDTSASVALEKWGGAE